MATPGELIPDLLQELKSQGDLIEEDIYTLCYCSKGSVSREAGFRMSRRERKSLTEIIKKFQSE